MRERKPPPPPPPPPLCTYCQRILRPRGTRELLAETDDHVEPRRNGGKQTVKACLHCNGIKGNMTLEEWRWFMNRFPRWWRRFPTPKPMHDWVRRIRPVARKPPKGIQYAHNGGKEAPHE